MAISIVALITPFQQDNSIDYKELERLCQFHIENETDTLLLLGTTAEAEALSKEEKRSLVQYVYQRVYPKIRIMVGLISNITDTAIEEAKLFQNLDIDAYLVINPYYNKTNSSGLLKHFTYIADAVDHPVILYNVPKRTGMQIPADVVGALSYHRNIIGIKEASGDLGYQLSLMPYIKDSFKLYSGDDCTMLLSLFLGASGVISVIGNAFPKEVKLITSSFSKNLEVSKTVFYKLYPVISSMYQEVSPIGIKYMMYLIGFETYKYRRPLDEPSKEFRRILEKVMLEIVEE